MALEKPDIPEVGASDNENHRDYLKNYLCLNNQETERLALFQIKDLPEHYQKQYELLNDQKFENVMIAVIPDDLWQKGNQPSESHAENQLILFKESYFSNPDNLDEIAWMRHEFAHCKKFIELDYSQEKYQKAMQTSTFNDIASEYPYPNNEIEEYAFTEQFKYLKQQGRTREQIIKMLENYYDSEKKSDYIFFNRLLDKLYN